MPNDPTKVKVGAGILYIAPVGTVEPTNLTTPWGTVSANWVAIGYTEEGHEFSREPNFEAIEVAEEDEPIRYEQTGVASSLSFSAAEMTKENLSRAFNGGTVTTISGTVVRFDPPVLGSATRAAIGWESNDGKERWVFRKCLQTGNVTIARRKAPNKAVIPMTFRLEKVSGQLPFTAIMDTA
jgi:hypothetical protein